MKARRCSPRWDTGRSPAVCGDVAWAATASRHIQDMGPEGLDIEAMAGPVSRATLRLPLAFAAASYARQAVAIATRPGQQGPVLLVAPLDRASDLVEQCPAIPMPVCAGDVLPAANRSTVVNVARQLAAARRPLVVVGAACRTAVGEVQAMAAGGPALLDIRQDPDIRIKGAGRVEALQHMSGGIRA